MGESLHRAAPELLHYRPWRGTFRRAGAGVWPVARTALKQIFGRRLFWALYGLGLMTFFLFFFGQYLVGCACLRVPGPGDAPPWPWAALVLGGVCLTCLTYLTLRIRAVEVVR